MLTQNLGYPRIGGHRELKKALESFWKKEISSSQLEDTARSIRQENWELQRSNHIDLIPSNDFSLYDHVLDMSIMLGAIPHRFNKQSFLNKYEAYFAMARGYQDRNGQFIPPMEMTKWFNTNYHYIVPEISPESTFKLNQEKITREIQETKDIGVQSVPVIIGPVTYLLLSKSTREGYSPLDRLEELLPIYKKLFSSLTEYDLDFLRIDEPFLTTDLTSEQTRSFQRFFEYFITINDRPRCILTTYFGDISKNINLLSNSPFEGIHIDLVNTADKSELYELTKHFQYISLGVIDGRNIWLTDLSEAVTAINKFQAAAPKATIIISPSCSLLHVPLDVNLETEMDATIRSWLSFGKQKLEELSALKAYFSNMEKSEYLFKRNQTILDARKIFQKADEDQKTHTTKKDDLYRKSPFKIRQEAQKKALGLPLLPTTTIGSFPQTKKVRSKRFGFNKGRIPSDEYFTFLKGEIERTIRIQEELDLDVLVHGEFERNDMVQYFAEQLEGFAFTRYGWVQSYGSRCVRPPIIFKQIRRIHPMTIEWIEYAQSLTPKPVKGMLTGPVTILQWSFVRDDQPREITCREIAFAVREEVLDLEKAGIKIIQIDEPAFREGLPINKKERENYLRWAVNCFRIASGGVRDDTQIHTHMCYSEFNEMMDSIALMDADVISIEASRSKMELLNAFTDFEYPNEIGPGVYDIHSPGIPEVSEIAELIRKALQVIPSDRLWINPDCGLKTRQWEEVLPSLTAMVNGAKIARIELSKG